MLGTLRLSEGCGQSAWPWVAGITTGFLLCHTGCMFGFWIFFFPFWTCFLFFRWLWFIHASRLWLCLPPRSVGLLAVLVIQGTSWLLTFLGAFLAVISWMQGEDQFSRCLGLPYSSFTGAVVNDVSFVHSYSIKIVTLFCVLYKSLFTGALNHVHSTAIG